jgi:predicted GH43/DUF377 family glycosyl hydrolase
MLRIFDLLYQKKHKLLSQKVFFCEHQDLVYLIVQDRNSGKIIKSAKSNDGLLFRKVKVKEEIVKQYPQFRDKRRSFIKERYANHLAPASEFMDHSKISMQNAFKTSEGVLLFYHYHNYQAYQVGVAGFSDGDDPHLIWRHHQPVWEMYDQVAGKKIEFIDLLEIKGQYVAYWLVEDEAVWATVYPNYRITEQIEIVERSQLNRPQANPLISPEPTHDWESFNTFNPAALYEADKVHLLYRAQGYDYVSSIGYASSEDGLSVEQKLERPIFVPTQPFEIAVKPGQVNMAFASAGCGGCEDPRLTRIDDRIYMTYVAFNGYSEPRIALTSIALKDFLNQNWLWTHPVLISKPGLVTKSACILPEKINGKYVVFHRVFPDILIDFRDDLDFSDGQYLKGDKKISPRSALWWDSRKIGVGAPPLKTKDGWLLIYQSIDDKEGHPYKVGAMLLDLEDPSVVLHRSSQPILQPQEWYENDGFKAGVVYPCGAVIIDQTLFVYYGGADSRVCVATANLNQFLLELKKEGRAKVEPTIITKLDKKSLAKRGLFRK